MNDQLFPGCAARSDPVGFTLVRAVLNGSRMSCYRSRIASHCLMEIENNSLASYQGTDSRQVAAVER